MRIIELVENILFSVQLSLKVGSLIYTNNRTSTKRPCLLRPLFVVPAGNPHIHSYSNLSATATVTKTRPPAAKIRSSRSYYGDAEDNVDQKMNLYFTYESQDTLKSFTLFITVKAFTKLNLGHRNKFEIEFPKISRRRSRSSDNAELVFSRCCFAEDYKEMYRDL